MSLSKLPPLDPTIGMRRQCSIAADRLAIVAADGVFSHYDLADAAARVAGELARDGADLAEARVAFLVPPTFAHVVVSRGIWLAGGVAVPLATSHPPAELEYVVRDSDASIVVGSGRQADALEAIAAAKGARFIRTPDLLATDAAPMAVAPPAPDRRAMIVYTSGTTGKPKGAVTTHGNMAAQIASLDRGLGMDAGRRRAAGAAAASRARHRQRARLRAGRGRQLRDAAAVRRRAGVGPARVRRDHGVHRRADDLPPADRVLGRGAGGGAARAARGQPPGAADDVGIGGAARAHARALARDHAATRCSNATA